MNQIYCNSEDVVVWYLDILRISSWQNCHKSPVVTVGTSAALLRILNPDETSQPGIFPDAWEFAFVPPCSLPVGSAFKPHTGLIAEQEALPWHHFDTQVFLIQAQGELLQLKPNYLQFSS